MTQEEKQELLIDLCARIPYGVKAHTWYNKPMDVKCTGVDVYTNTVNLDIPNDDDAKVYIENVKPYLRLMSSMTEEEKIEYGDRCYFTLECISTNQQYYFNELYDWLNSHHFDYHGLIEKGLAIAVTKENNPYKK